MITQCDHNVIEPYVVTTIRKVLGYCCPWAFFAMFRQTSMIAFRLGVTPRTIRLYKAKFRDGEFQCERCEKCMRASVKASGKLK